MNTTVYSGFSAPVFDSQKAFRATMNAMANPGSIQNMPVSISSPEGLPSAAAALVLAMCDFETAIWISPEVKNANEIMEYCVFQTGCKRAKSAKYAQFVVMDLTCGPLRLDSYHMGTAEYPDLSSTLIALSPNLTTGVKYKLSGPGILGEADFAVSGLPHDFSSEWALNKAGFPLGVDMIFCAGASLLALPRSTHVEKV